MTELAEQTEAYQRDDGIWIIQRRKFASEHFDYKDGQHVAFLGPTQKGKTSLAFCLLEYVATPQRPAYVAVCKPQDPVTAREGKRLGFRRTPVWPPAPKIQDSWNGKPPGYLIWPPLGNMTTDVVEASDTTRTLIDSAYSDGRRNKKSILVLDDTPIKSKVLGLDREMVTVLTMSGAMGVGGWFFVQKPTDAGKAALWCYSQSEHIFITKDPDKRNRIRYSEIGGFDTAQVNQVSQSLKPYQFLYLERTHGYMCIVDSK